MDDVIPSYIEKLTEQYPDINSIWLFGSRANDTFREDSDWDLFVFGNEQVLVSLRNNFSFKNDSIDILFVVNGDDFVSPWSDKSGRLSDWQWKEISSTEASYIGTKEPTDGTGWFRAEIKEQKAIKVWPK